jgi:glycosyltransferase involved in cell wall biosynthesis
MKKRKSKLFIFPANFYPHVGGLESHVDLFSKYLSKNYAYTITIIAPQYANAPYEEYIHEGRVRVLRYPSAMPIPNFPIPKIWKKKFWEVLIGLYKERPDFVMSRTLFFTNSTLGMIYAKFRFKPLLFVHVEHGASLPHLTGFLKNLVLMFYVHTFGRLTLLLANAKVCVSNGVKDFLKEYYGEKEKRLLVIRRGFETQELKISKEDSELKKKAKEKKVLFFAGRLTEGKGVQDILHALKELEDDSLHLFIAGDGGYKKELEDLTKKYRLQKQVTFLGSIPHARVLNCLKTSEIFINSSYSEGLPTVVLDALFSGTKTIATNVGGTQEILERHWSRKKYRLINSHAPEEIKRAIKELLKVKNERDEVVENYLKKRFDWEEHAKDYHEIFEELMTTRKRQSKS